MPDLPDPALAATTDLVERLTLAANGGSFTNSAAKAYAVKRTVSVIADLAKESPETVAAAFAYFRREV